MGLCEFLKMKDCSALEFSLFYRISSTTVYNVISGRDIRMSTAIALTQLTNGQVTLEGIAKELLAKKDLRTSRFPAVEEKFA